MSVWDLSGAPLGCDLYRLGHQVHWIQHSKSVREPGEAIAVIARVDQDGLVHLDEGDDRCLTLWNHRPGILQLALERFGGMAVWQPRWRLLAIPTDAFMGSACSAFSMAEADQQSRCRTITATRA